MNIAYLLLCFNKPMFKISTLDGHLVELEEQYSSKSNLLQNLMEYSNIDSPVKLLIDRKTLLLVYNFMQKDMHVLKKGYNPLEIHFSYEMLHFFDSCTPQELLDVCNSANYLEYPFLLELCCKILANELSDSSNLSKCDFPFKILGDERINEEDLEKISKDFDWMNEDL